MHTYREREKYVCIYIYIYIYICVYVYIERERETRLRCGRPLQKGGWCPRRPRPSGAAPWPCRRWPTSSSRPCAVSGVGIVYPYSFIVMGGRLTKPEENLIRAGHPLTSPFSFQ